MNISLSTDPKCETEGVHPRIRLDSFVKKLVWLQHQTCIWVMRSVHLSPIRFLFEYALSRHQSNANCLC